MTASMTKLSMDRRCNDYTKSFKDEEGIVVHCKEQGFTPPMANHKSGDNPRPANHEILLVYANVTLNRAMGKRLAKWGLDHIDPVRGEKAAPTRPRATSIALTVGSAPPPAVSSSFSNLSPAAGDSVTGWLLTVKTAALIPALAPKVRAPGTQASQLALSHGISFMDEASPTLLTKATFEPLIARAIGVKQYVADAPCAPAIFHIAPATWRFTSSISVSAARSGTRRAVEAGAGG